MEAQVCEVTKVACWYSQPRLRVMKEAVKGLEENNPHQVPIHPNVFLHIP